MSTDDKNGDLAEALVSHWQHVKRVLSRADDHGPAWVEAIEQATGGVTVRDGRPLYHFEGAYYSVDPRDGSVLVVRDENGRTVGRTYSPDGALVAEHDAPGPTTPDLN